MADLGVVDAGADGIFVPGLAREVDIAAVTAVPVPVNVLHLPAFSLQQLAELGVRQVTTGSLLFRAALNATVTTALAVREGEPLPAGIHSYAEVDALSR